jgi:hypothetical protein
MPATLKLRSLFRSCCVWGSFWLVLCPASHGLKRCRAKKGFADRQACVGPRVSVGRNLHFCAPVGVGTYWGSPA